MFAKPDRRTKILRIVISLAAVAVMALGFSFPLEGQEVGSVTGSVVAARPPAATPPTKVTNQTDICGSSQPAGDVVTGRGGALAAAAVWLEGVAKRPAVRPRDITLGQLRCRFEPRVQTAMVGSNLAVTSRDAVLHNVHAFINGDRTLFNIALPVAGMTVRKPLREAGHVRFRCDAGHTWMAAHVWVFDHPYHTVTGNDGSFRIADVPPGNYRLHVWHERLGDKTAQVTVAAGQAATVPVRY